MDAKQYLNSLGEFDERIGRKIRRLGELDAARLFSAEDIGKLKSARELLAREGFDDLRSEITEDLSELRRKRREAAELLKRLDNSKFERVLYKHYVEYKPIKDIADELFLSRSYTHRLHQEALDALGDVL